MRHENNGFCPMCHLIIGRYPGFNENLKSWFMGMQKAHPELHTSCAGRGRQDQEDCKRKGSSNAHWGESAHNYNCALDLFFIVPGSKDIYPMKWFREVLSPNVPTWVEWFGTPGSKFWELPHVEVRGWKNLIATGVFKLVEDHTGSKIA